MLKIIRKIIGVIVIITGLIGTLVPIPLVPFFLLVFVGLAIFGVEKETIQKWKSKFVKRK